MSEHSPSRRTFLKELGLASGAALLSPAMLHAVETRAPAMHLATNQYPWFVFYQRENRDFNASLDTGLGEIASTGMQGYEPGVNAPGEIDQLAPLLQKHHLEMRSVYVGSVLHEAAEVDKNVDKILAIADKAKQIGTRIIVTNPSPIRWGGAENKDDAQLKLQASALDRLGRQLAGMGMTLAYHNHDIELRNAAREFHHMMLGTDSKHLTLCLDAHWVYRGAGNSAVALFDVVELYGSRVSELHIRQSVKNVWTEALTDGDIDYRALTAALQKRGVKPHLVLEQAVEKDSPKTMDAVEAHRRSVAYAREVFGPLQ